MTDKHQDPFLTGKGQSYNDGYSDISDVKSEREKKLPELPHSEFPHHPPHSEFPHHPPHSEPPHHPPHSEFPHHPPHSEFPPHHQLPHHRQKKIIGLNSLLAETLKELLPTFKDIDTIGIVVRALDRDAFPIFTRVCAEGITDPAVFVERFLEIEASERMHVRNCMLSDVRQSLAIVLFPLPPYIIELLRPVLNRKLSFNTTEHVPVHIQRDKFPLLDYEKYQQLFSSAHGIHSLVLDGQRSQKTLTIRPNAASLLELLRSKSLKRVYFHKIPHLPHGERFVTIDIADYEIEMHNI